MKWIRSHKPTSVAVGAMAVVFAAWLMFGFFGIQAVFIDEEVDEAAPVFDSGAGSPGGDETTTIAPDTAASAGGATPTPPSMTPTIEEVASGTFIDRSHPSSGRAVVVSDGSQTFVRFEEFETDNGPDLFVYLSRGVAAAGPEGLFDDDFVNLGALKGNVGDQNYEVPSGVSVTDYATVVIWCRRFSVAFGAANLV